MKICIKKFHTSFGKYWAITKINFANKITYPIDIFSEVMFLIFTFSILFFLYRAMDGIAPSSPVEKLSLAQIIWITFFANIFGCESGKGVSHILNDEIISGQIAYQLNRPYSYLIFHFAQHFGTKLPTIIFGGVTSGVFLYFIVGIPPISFGSFFLGSIMLCIGMVISFLIQFCIGLCAFWIGDNSPIRWIYRQVMIIAGGAAVPIALFPSVIKKIILLMPFSNVVYGAARIIVGCPRSDVFSYIGLQIFWLFMMLIITKSIFKIGVKNVVICGG